MSAVATDFEPSHWHGSGLPVDDRDSRCGCRPELEKVKMCLLVSVLTTRYYRI